MKTRQQAITYGLTFPHTYVESPFKDPNWELVRVKGSKKAFSWVYEKDGYINLKYQSRSRMERILERSLRCRHPRISSE